MDKTLISWNVPNMITIWLMLFIGFLILSLGVQFLLPLVSGGSQPANNSGGY